MATPDFILDLRGLVGSRQLWVSGATAVVHRPGPAGTAVLLVKCSNNGEWTPVSGTVYPGEVATRLDLACVPERTADAIRATVRTSFAVSTAGLPPR